MKILNAFRFDKFGWNAGSLQTGSPYGLFRDLLSKQITHTESLFAGYNAGYAEASSTFLLYCLTSGKNCESLVFVFAFSLRKIEIPRTLREIVFFYVSAESRSTPVVRASTKR